MPPPPGGKVDRTAEPPAPTQAVAGRHASCHSVFERRRLPNGRRCAQFTIPGRPRPRCGTPDRRRGQHRRGNVTAGRDRISAGRPGISASGVYRITGVFELEDDGRGVNTCGYSPRCSVYALVSQEIKKIGCLLPTPSAVTTVGITCYEFAYTRHQLDCQTNTESHRPIPNNAPESNLRFIQWSTFLLHTTYLPTMKA